jgi:hypothetical protein
MEVTIIGEGKLGHLLDEAYTSLNSTKLCVNSFGLAKFLLPCLFAFFGLTASVIS